MKLYNKMKIAIILPAYNEEKTIVQTINEFNKFLPDAYIFVVNNRSTDSTEFLARETLDALLCCGGVINEPRPGKGNAIRRAFLDIDADIYLLADADLTYPASQAKELLSLIKNDCADMVVGDRHVCGDYMRENKRPMHNFGNALVKRMVNLLFGAKLSDIMSGYRAMNRRFVKTYPILVEGFEIETDMTLHALDKSFRIIEHPISYKDRPDGSFSKLSTIHDGFKVVLTIAKILRYYRPLFFFGGLSIIFFLMGICAGVPVIGDWLSERYIYHVPLAILATGLEIVSIIFVAIGLILDSIANQDKRNFQRDLLLFDDLPNKLC